jgi:flagellar hook-length control protein FliK
MDVRFFPSLVPLKLPSERIQRSPLTFHPGEQLIAKVLAQTAPGRLLLEISGRKLMAETELNFPAGTSLRLEVVQIQPKIQLRVLADLNPMTIMVSALRQTLPRQIPLDQALRSLEAALGQPNLAPPVRTQIEALLNSLPDRIALGQPDKLASAMRQSGLFTEALAATAVQTPIVATDLKTRLLELAASIKTALAQTTTLRPGHAPAAAIPASPAPTPSNSPTAPTSEQETPTSQAESSFSRKPDLLPELAEKVSGALAQTTTLRLGHAPAAAIPASPAPTPSNSPTAPTSEQETPTSQAASTFSGKSDLLPELAEKVSGALARIVVDQIASLPKPETQALSWHLEIPFRDEKTLESLQLTIAGERRAKGDPSETSPWTVDLEMTPPGLGRIRVRLVLQGEKISSYFWGESETTLRLLEHHLDTLAQRFRAAGLEPNCLQALGELRASTRSAPTEPMITGPLLDEKI